LEPYLVIKRHHDEGSRGLREDKFNALVARALEIGDPTFATSDPIGTLQGAASKVTMPLPTGVSFLTAASQPMPETSETGDIEIIATFTAQSAMSGLPRLQPAVSHMASSSASYFDTSSLFFGDHQTDRDFALQFEGRAIPANISRVCFVVARQH
jgi:hypothetical protein